MIIKNLPKTLFAVCLVMSANLVNGQGMAVNTSGAAAATTAILDVTSTTQGVLVPRMTAAQRTAILAPATGLLVYQSDGTSGFYFYNGAAWTSLNTPGGSAGGDLSGTYPNPTISSSAGTGNNIVTAINASGGGLSGGKLTSSSVPATALSATGTADATHFLAGNNTWQTVSGGGTTLNNGTAAGQIYVTGTTPFAVNPTPVAVSGNATLSSTGVLAVTSLPAISGANLTNITPSNLTSGGTLPFENGSNLTSLNGSNISSGTVAIARGGTGQTTATAAFNTLSPMTTAGDIVYYNASSAQRLPIGTSGQVLTVASGIPSWATSGGGSGTVTSVSCSNLTPLFTTSVSNATTTPSITHTLSNAAAHTFLGNSTGSAAVPVYSAVDVTADITGTLPEGNGGTGNSSYTVGDILYASASGTLSKLNAGTSGNVLTSNGAATAPSWQASSGGSGSFVLTSNANTSVNATTEWVPLCGGGSLFANSFLGACSYLGHSITIDAVDVAYYDAGAGSTGTVTFTLQHATLSGSPSTTDIGSYSLSRTGAGTTYSGTMSGMPYTTTVGQMFAIQMTQPSACLSCRAMISIKAH